ncbi:MAG: hypothetical protein HYX34_12420 [Actinobacteria bacterium]|nr:hypothetical protein [Actinomycetota bacterium]
MEPRGTERLAAIEAELAQVERALGRIDDGTYGRCSVCGDDIDDEVLRTTPLSSLCPAHLDVVPDA